MLVLWFTPVLTAASAAAATDRQIRTFPSGRTLAVHITIGEVQIVGSARSDVSLEIVRRASNDSRLARMPIEIEETESDLQVRVLQADGNTDPTLRSDITMRVPAGVRIGTIRVVEGRIGLSSLHGTIAADIRRGPVYGSNLAGTVRLESGIGDVTVDKAMLTPGGLLRLRAFNGDVKLSLAQRPQNARVLALALNGTIVSDIPLTMKDTWGPRFGEATLGRGDPVISIDVVTGKIEIRSP